MKKIGTVILMVTIAFGLSAGDLWASAEYNMEDSIWDKAGDWVATAGKSADERDEILLERQTARQAARFQRAIRLESKKAGKKVEKFSKEMEKLFES